MLHIDSIVQRKSFLHSFCITAVVCVIVYVDFVRLFSSLLTFFCRLFVDININKKALLMPRAARDSVSIREYWLPIAYDECGAPW